MHKLYFLLTFVIFFFFTDCKLRQIWMLARHSISSDNNYWSPHVHELLQKYHNNISESYDLGGKYNINIFNQFIIFI